MEGCGFRSGHPPAPVKTGLRAEDSVPFGSAQTQSRTYVTPGWIPCAYPHGSQHSLAENQTHKWRTNTLVKARGRLPRPPLPATGSARRVQGRRTLSKRTKREGEEEPISPPQQSGEGLGRATGSWQTNPVYSKDLFRKLKGFFSRGARLSLCFPSSLSLSPSPFKSHQACNQQQKLT